MQCPFLKETVVRSCRHALVRKLIVRNPENLALERCSSAAYSQCALYLSAPNDAGSSRCPYLDESLAQYCAAAPVARYIPFSEALLSRCGSDAFRYCDLYITMAHPPELDADAVPSWLLYARNHMWLDPGEDGVCHVGIDGLLARALGHVDRITYLTMRGITCPAVVLSAGPVDFHMVFPNRLQIATPNLYLRADPSKLTADPYRLGWLFECRCDADRSDVKAGLIPGGDAADRWMQSEYNRVGAFVHALSNGSTDGNDVLVADGGSFAPGLIQQLDRTRTAQLYHEFFSPSSMR